MCGIYGCLGSSDGINIVIEGLKKLQYRGYDSCGIAYIKKNKIECKKAVGTLDKIKINKKTLSSQVIGHTRWATHGKVNVRNAHPHISNNGRFALVHNGIIENYLTYLNELKKQKFKFYSDTDTEVIVNLIQNSDKSSTLEKLMQTCKLLKGSYALLLLDIKENAFYLAKHKSPLNLCIENNAVKVSSDIQSLNSEKIYCFDDDEFAVIKNADNIEFYKNGKKFKKSLTTLKQDEYKVEKDVEHFMLKEILEIPSAYQRTFDYLKNNLKKIDFSKYEQIFLIGCGTAYHSCLVGGAWLQALGFINVQCFIASEFRYANLKLNEKCCIIFVSQSGETADTIACAELTKNLKCYNIVITNVENSTITKFADELILIKAGTEVAVASTKAYNCQMLAFERMVFDNLASCDEINGTVNCIFNNSENIKDIAKSISGSNHLICIGRGLDHYIAMEASLKIKEISYIPTTAIASGELKHGTISLIDNKSIVIAIVTVGHLKEKSINALHEIKARNGKVLLVTCFDDIDKNLYDHMIKIDKLSDELMYPLLSIVPLQLLAYYIAVNKGYNPDMPRNLAKSVTVE